MDTKKLKEEIRLLERKLELLEQINRLQVPVYPVYPSYPVYPNTYPWWQTYPNWSGTENPTIVSYGTTGFTVSGITTGSACGQAGISGATVIKDDAQVSYTNCTPPILKDSDHITIRGMSWGKSPQYSHHKIVT